MRVRWPGWASATLPTSTGGRRNSRTLDRRGVAPRSSYRRRDRRRAVVPPCLPHLRLPWPCPGHPSRPRAPRGAGLTKSGQIVYVIFSRLPLAVLPFFLFRNHVDNVPRSPAGRPVDRVYPERDMSQCLLERPGELDSLSNPTYVNVHVIELMKNRIFILIRILSRPDGRPDRWPSPRAVD